MVTGICILAMSVIMFSYLESADLLNRKAQIGQLARKYILRMETVGYLTEQDRTVLQQELMRAGVSEFTLEGSTMEPVSYGMPIVLQIQGNLGGEHAFTEKRVSTAKN